MLHEGVSFIDHYLITMGPPGSEECGCNLDRILAICKGLGVPLAEEKFEGPSHYLTFLGTELATLAGRLWLPGDKLSRLKDTLAEWSAQQSCQCRKLQSLIGTLQHACQFVKPGRAFLRRMIDLLRIPWNTITSGSTVSSMPTCGGSHLHNTGMGWPCSSA